MEKEGEGFEYWEALDSAWKYALPNDVLRLRGMKTYFLVRHQTNCETPFAGRYITRLEESTRELLAQTDTIDVESTQPAPKKVSSVIWA